MAKRNSILNSSNKQSRFSKQTRKSFAIKTNSMVIDDHKNQDLSPQNSQKNSTITFCNQVETSKEEIKRQSTDGKSNFISQKHDSDTLIIPKREAFNVDDVDRNWNILSMKTTPFDEQPKHALEKQIQFMLKQPSVKQLIVKTPITTTPSTEVIQKQSTLAQRRSKLINLNPLVTKSPMDTLKATTNKGDSSGGISKTPPDISPSLRKHTLQQNVIKRQETIKKFQTAVKQALKQSRQQPDGPLVTRNLDTYTDLISKKLNPGKLKVPASPLLKAKMTFFEVVNRLKGFTPKSAMIKSKSEKNVFETSKAPSMKLIDDEEIKKLKRDRARQLWRKAKSVLRAINTWKSIQTEIQLYGTHNYEFRQTFKVAQGQNKLKKQATIKAAEAEKKKKRRCKTYIDPEQRFKQLWSVLILIFILYIGLFMPFSMAFLSDSRQHFAVDVMADFVFMSDVMVTLLSAYYDDEGILVTSNKRIFLKYLKGWLLIDLFASIPVNLLENEIEYEIKKKGKFLQLLRLLRLPRLHRLIQMSRLGKIFSNMSKSSFIFKLQEFFTINAGLIRLFSFVGTGFICIHISTCFWFLSARLSDFEPDTWVVRGNLQDESIGRQYLSSLYWSVATVLTVGYGDIHAQTSAERLLAICWMLIGVAVYAFSIGILTSVLAKMDTRESQLNSKLEIIDEFCQEAKISHTLKKKIRDAIEYHTKRNAFSMIQKHNIFHELPTNLKYNIAIQIHDGAIGKLPFFYNKDDAFVANIVPRLQPLKILANEYIYMHDDHPYDIYFIMQGRVNFLMNIGECIFKSWPQGSYFGEIEIIFQKKRICTAKADANCDLFTLNKKYYQTIIYNDYPEIERQLRDLAIEREYRIEQTLEKATTVLEAIGIQEALLLPQRADRSRRGSQTSFNSSKRKTISQLSRIAQMRALAKSFELAHSQMSENSKKMNIEDNHESQKDEQNSSSSNDYNIWGDKNQTSEESKNEDQEEIKQNQTEKNEQNFERFADFFNNKKKKRKESQVEPEMQRKQTSHFLGFGLSQQNLEQISSQSEDNSDYELDASHSFSGGFEGSLPNIKIIGENTPVNQDQQPFQHSQSDKFDNKLLHPYVKGTLQSNDDLLNFDDQPQKQDEIIYTPMPNNKDLVNTPGPRNIYIQRKSEVIIVPKIINNQPQPIKHETPMKTYHSDMKLDQDDQSALSSAPYMRFAHKNNSSNYLTSVDSEIQLFQAFKEQYFSQTKIKIQSKVCEFSIVPQHKSRISNISSKTLSQNNHQQQFQQQIMISHQIIKDQQDQVMIQLNKMKQNLNKGYSAQGVLEDRVVGLLQSVELMSKMMKDVVTKQRAKEKKRQIEEKKLQQDIVQKFTQPPQKSKEKDWGETVFHSRNHSRIQDATGSNFQQQSFTLNSDDSLIPIKRDDRSSTTLEARGEREKQKWRFVDDLEELQKAESSREYQSEYSARFFL